MADFVCCYTYFLDSRASGCSSVGPADVVMHRAGGCGSVGPADVGHRPTVS